MEGSKTCLLSFKKAYLVNIIKPSDSPCSRLDETIYEEGETPELIS